MDMGGFEEVLGLGVDMLHVDDVGVCEGEMTGHELGGRHVVFNVGVFAVAVSRLRLDGPVVGSARNDGWHVV